MIQTDTSSIQYNGNNSTITLYPVPFYFLTEPDLVVVVKDANDIEELQVLGTDYVVNGEGNLTGGSIRTTWPVPVESTVAISRSIDATQLTSYEEGDSFPAKSHERALDKLTMLVQQSLRVTGSGGTQSDGRAFRLTDASTGISAVSKVNDSMLGIDVNGNAILRDSGETLGWLGQVGTTWLDDAERLNTSGAFTGQLGVQRNNGAIYEARSTTPGDWVAFLKQNGIVIATNGVPTAVIQPAGDIVGTNESQVLTNKTLIAPTITDPVGLDKSDVGLSNVDNTKDIDKPVSTAQSYAINDRQALAEKGIANGYPSLDAAAKIPISQMPDALVGASQYQGTWNASTNTPAIPPAILGNKGWYYSVSVAGTTNIDGINSWAVGDQIISNGTVWQKIVNVSAVSSVNSKTGAVVLVPSDIGLGNVSNTSDATKNSAVATLTNKTINGANNTLTVRLDSDVTNNLPVARLNNGTGAAADTWWCGDNSWKKPPGTGDVNGPAGAADNDIAVFNGVTGKLIKTTSRPVGDIVSGPSSAVDNEVTLFSGATGKLIKSSSKLPPAGQFVGTTDAQQLSNKTFFSPAGGLEYRPSGLIFQSTALVGNPTPAESVLVSYTFPAGLFAKDGDSARVHSVAATTSGSGTRTVVWRMDGQVIYSSGSSATVAKHFGTIIITRMSSTQFRASTSYATTADAGNGSGAQMVTLTSNPANALLFVVNGAGPSANLMFHYHTTIEFLPLL